jgi:hypothetical protein
MNIENSNSYPTKFGYCWWGLNIHVLTYPHMNISYIFVVFMLEKKQLTVQNYLFQQYDFFLNKEKIEKENNLFNTHLKKNTMNMVLKSLFKGFEFKRGKM